MQGHRPLDGGIESLKSRVEFLQLPQPFRPHGGAGVWAGMQGAIAPAEADQEARGPARVNR